MKITRLILTGITALVAIGSQPIHAALSYSSGDLYMGFSQTGNSTSDFAVNIGNAGQYRDALAPIALTLTNLTTTLNGIFGNGWQTNAALNVQWAIFGTTQNTASTSYSGTQDPIRVLYSTKPFGDPAPVQQSTQTGTATNIVNLVDYYSNGKALGTISNLTESSVTNGTIGSPGNGNSVTTRAITGSPFGTVNLNQVYAPVATTTLDLWRTPQGTSQTTGTTLTTISNRGTFSISGDVLTFTPTAVPEPSTYALVGGALVALGLVARKRRKLASASR